MKKVHFKGCFAIKLNEPDGCKKSNVMKLCLTFVILFCFGGFRSCFKRQDRNSPCGERKILMNFSQPSVWESGEKPPTLLESQILREIGKKRKHMQKTLAIGLYRSAHILLLVPMSAYFLSGSFGPCSRVKTTYWKYQLGTASHGNLHFCKASIKSEWGLQQDRI